MKREVIRKWKKRVIYIAIFMLMGIGAVTQKDGSVLWETLGEAREGEKRFTVYIDAGHGGVDPGKVGINGKLEKDINLQISEKIGSFLKQADVEVVYTRQTDAGLYDESDSNKKREDMKNRVKKMEEAKPDLIVSIHQNSYPEEDVHGAQTFYYDNSSEGKRAAEILQEQLIKTIDPDNHRTAKANDSYYLLKKTSYPIVIAECGFLSNREEAQKLTEPYYQEKVAWAVYMGVMRYLNLAQDV